MRKGYKTIAVTLSMVLALTGIIGSSSVKSDAKAKIALNKKKVTLTVGKSVKLKLKGTRKKAKWSSSNEKVAMVGGTGKVVALKAGKAKITAKIKKKKYTCNVIVKKKAAESQETATPTNTSAVTQKPATSSPAQRTNSPSATNRPTGTATPSNTSTPGTTENPNVTHKPGSTDDPNITDNPEYTDEPEYTEEPDDPEVTAKPERTRKPSVTSEPEYTDEPEYTEEPDDPEVTAKPGRTEKPSVTSEPQYTEEPEETEEPAQTDSPVKPRVVYQFAGRVTGWGGPDTYPSSEGHEQGDGTSNDIYSGTEANSLKAAESYNCGVEFMNPYNPVFTGASNEMAVLIKTMKDPVIRVYLENGGAASAYNWDDELICPSGQEVALTESFLANGYIALFGNDDTITKVEFYDRSTTVVEPEEPSQPEETEEPENPSLPNESYTPDIPVVTPGTTDVENEALASNMTASLQKLADGNILLKVLNNNAVTVNYFFIKVTFKDAQGNVLTGETSDGEAYEDTGYSYGRFLEKNGLYYDYVYPASANKDKVDLSKSEISIEVDQTLWEDNNYTPLTSKIAVTTQKQIDEDDGSSQIAYEIKNNDSKDASISMVILFKDVRGNVVGVRDVFEIVSAGNTYSGYVYGPYDDNYEDIDFASYEVHINGYMHDDSEG